VTITASTNPQHMQALERANYIRRGAVEHRRWITEGRLSVLDVLDPKTPIPEVLESTKIGKLLRAQRLWGDERTRRFLTGVEIPESRRLDALTVRQRKALIEALIEAEARVERRPGRSRQAVAA
jgi:hypothetical protein